MTESSVIRSSSDPAKRWVNALIAALGACAVGLGLVLAWKWWTRPEPIVVFVSKPVGERVLCVIESEGHVIRREGIAPVRWEFHVDELSFAAVSASPQTSRIWAGLDYGGGAGTTSAAGVEGSWSRGGTSILGGMYQPDTEALRETWELPADQLQGFNGGP